jgi:hypothetical protein
MKSHRADEGGTVAMRAAQWPTVPMSRTVALEGRTVALRAAPPG